MRTDSSPLSETKKCVNHGCGSTFTEGTNSDKACRYHPMAPIFHETIKRWPCCDSKSDDFDEFLRIAGCTVGFHRTKTNGTNLSQAQQPSSDCPLKSSDITSQSALPAATEAASAVSPSNTAARSSKPTFQNESSTAKQQVEIIEEPDDPLDAVIEPGAKCLHSFCSAVFSGDSSRTEPCVYHPGIAVFYEGSKYWSCCRPRAGEFEEFLKIPGCKTGRHKFLKSGAPTDPNFVECRRDYYQLGDQMCVCVYGKNMNPKSSSVTYCTQSVKIDIQFLNGKTYSAFIPLFSQIVPEACTHEWLPTKLEIKMKKCHPGPWTKLESEEPISTN
ncbi:cysteine and histidine-rich domain-containing protein 1-like [Schistocerca gregaria]|uniref:cysteine and histidine-rich domain-containing protein 1-like n=1 Tax=Schistocerca gregaria TaxID=7010 RepID=UPI00211EE783|nr:cysteine and histidine-rich domain-containing protein 1-like [Schistocerca gregaria]